MIPVLTMGQLILSFADLLFVALLAGTMFGLWLNNRPFNMSSSFYVEQQQQAIRRLNTPMPVLGGICILLTIASLMFARGNVRSFSLLAVALALLVAAGLITRLGNQPINAQVMTWSIQSPPPDWTKLRDRWWLWHVARTLAGILALSCLIMEALLACIRS